MATTDEQARAAAGKHSRVGTWVWRLCLVASAGMGIFGLLLIASMDPTSGPYVAGDRYPFGDEQRTYQVTVGFDWLAYAILFAAAAAAVRGMRGRGLVAAIAVSFAVLWLPHALIAVAMLVNGAS